MTSVECDVTQADAEKLWLNLSVSNPINRRINRRSQLITTLMSASLALYVLLTRTDASLGLILGGSLLAGALSFCLFSLSVRSSIKNSVATYTKSGALAYLIGWHRYTIQPDGLRCESRLGDGILYWHAIDDITATPELIVIRFSQIGTHAIPRRAFASDAHADAFIAEINHQRLRAAHQLGTEAVAVPAPSVAAPPTNTPRPSPAAERTGEWWTQGESLVTDDAPRQEQRQA